MQQALDQLKRFDLDSSFVTVWTFKKFSGVKGSPPSYTGRWIDTAQELNEALKDAVKEARSGISETIEYGLLAQNNEGSCLSIQADETYSALIVSETKDPIPSRKVQKLKDVNNTDFYTVKFVSGSDILYAVRKTDDSWRTRKSLGLMSVVFSDNQLTLETGTRFTMSKHFDFFIMNDAILISDKGKFESLLSYRQAYVDEFAELQKEKLFTAIFTDLGHLINYVGTNKIQLRRLSAIRQKGHYKNSDFMDRLREESGRLGFKILFDNLGRIIPTEDNCRDIVQALLDHRLDSRLSKKLYDVANAADVANI